MRNVWILGIAIAGVFAVGCYRTTAFTGLPRGGPTFDHNAPHFIEGASSAEVDVSHDCQNGVAAVSTRMSFLDLFLSWITFEIYTPTSMEVECAPVGAQYAPQPAPQYAPQVAPQVPPQAPR